MGQRFPGSTLALAIVVAVVSLPAIAGQAPAGKAKAGAKTFRTPWGDPDLQGVWNDATSTPLERPNGMKSNQLSGGQADDFQAELSNSLSRDRRDGSAEEDVNRAYNEHWMDSRRLKITA